jgi:hypothetical protein
MKTKMVMITIAGFFISSFIFAQTPNSFNYQAVLRDANGNIRANANVNVRIDIMQGSATGSIVFAETFTKQTNDFGLINLEIGCGTLVSGNFSSIDWAAGPYFVKISVDGVEFGASQLLSVPYAKYAEKAGGGFSGSYSDLTNVPANLDTDQTNDVITTGNQTIAGNKTFSGAVKVDSLSVTKKTTKWVFNPSFLYPANGSTGNITVAHFDSVSCVTATSTGTWRVIMGFDLPYKALGCTLRVAGVTINYKCESGNTYITDSYLKMSNKGVTEIIGSNSIDHVSTTASGYSIYPTLPSSGIFIDKRVYLSIDIRFNATGGSNRLMLYEFIVETY